MLEVVRLLLFPALMAFAAASDLLNMTISNRISLALVAGFAVLAVVCGLNPQTIAAHAAAGLL
ncbi:MAG: peptidase, partial [Xanthobacteraceae bacterium]